MPDLRYSTTDDLKQLDTLHPQPGDLFPWAAIEELLSRPRTDRRFRTIYQAWIRHVRKWHNRKIIVVPGIGLRVLHEHERASDVCKTLGRTWRLFDVAKTDADDIQLATLTARQLEETNFVRLSTHRLHASMALERAKLANRPEMPPASPTMPQRPIPDGLPVARLG